MQKNIRIGYLFSIEIQVQAALPVILAALFMTDLFTWFFTHNFWALSVLAICFWGQMILHELGHALFARKCFIHTRAISLTLRGGHAQLLRLPATRKERIGVFAAGPMVNILSLLLIGAMVFLTNIFNHVSAVFGTHLFMLSLLLTAVSLIPLRTFDVWHIYREFAAAA